MAIAAKLYFSERPELSAPTHLQADCHNNGKQSLRFIYASFLQDGARVISADLSSLAMERNRRLLPFQPITVGPLVLIA